MVEDEEREEVEDDEDDDRAGNGKGNGREVEVEWGEGGGREVEGSGHRDTAVSRRKFRARIMYFLPGWSVIWREGGQGSMYWRAAYTYRRPPVAILVSPSPDLPPSFPADGSTGTGKSTC